MTENEAIELLKIQRTFTNGANTKVEAIDMAIQALEEIQQYRTMEKRLNGISVEQVVDGFINTMEKGTSEGYEKGRILTNAEADMWDKYKEIGTVEDIKALSSMEIHNFNALQKYRNIGTIEEFKALKEKNTPMELLEHNFQDEVHHYLCPSCRSIVSYNQNYCEECGQALET